MNMEKSMRIVWLWIIKENSITAEIESFRLLRESIVNDIDSFVFEGWGYNGEERIVISIDLERNAFCYPVRERLKRLLSLESILGA